MKHENLSYISHHVHLILLLGGTSNSIRVIRRIQHAVLNNIITDSTIVSVDKETKRHHLVLRIREIQGSNPVGYSGRIFHDFLQALQSDLHRRPTLNQAMIASLNVLSHSLFTYLTPEMNPNRRFHLISVHRLPYVSRYAITWYDNSSPRSTLPRTSRHINANKL
jgi:hypothetical protein